MIVHEAIDAAQRVFVALMLLAGLVGAVCGLLVLVAAAAVWRLLGGAWRALVGRPGGVQALDVATEDGPTPEGVSARTDRRPPAWAHTDHHREDQAA